MNVEPHIAVQARIAALRAAVETRTGADTPEAIVARATTFEAYVLRDNPAPSSATRGAAQPEGKAGGVPGRETQRR